MNCRLALAHWPITSDLITSESKRRATAKRDKFQFYRAISLPTLTEMIITGVVSMLSIINEEDPFFFVHQMCKGSICEVYSINHLYGVQPSICTVCTSGRFKCDRCRLPTDFSLVVNNKAYLCFFLVVNSEDHPRVSLFFPIR